MKSKGQGNNKGVIRKVASLVAGGMSQVDAANKVGRCTRTISRMLNTEEAKEILKVCHMRIVEKAPKAVENITVAVDGFQAAFKQGDKVQAGISWEASKLVTQILGLSPTAQQSIVHQTYINSQTNMIDPVIAELMKKHLSPVIDAEIIENKELVSIPIENEG